MTSIKVGDILLAPLGVSLTDKTRVEVKSKVDKSGFIKVKYVEKEVKEELGNKPFKIDAKKLSPYVIPSFNKNKKILPADWVGQNMKEFPDWINRTFLPYKVKEVSNKKNTEFTTYQKFIRDYLSFSSPYRGLLLYHGLGSGKTCSSIAVAESNHQNVIVLSPATLRNNYLTALKNDPVCGSKPYHNNPNTIDTKYSFVSYNAPNTIEQIDRIGTLDNHTIVIDEIHNLVSMIVTKGKKGPEIYKRLMDAKNIKIVALSGTPVINYPFEIAMLANILRGYLEVPTLFVKEIKKGVGIDTMTTLLKEKVVGLEGLEYVDAYQRFVYLYLKMNSYDPRFERVVGEVMDIGRKNGVVLEMLEVKKFSLYPEDEDEFRSYFIEETEDGDMLKNVELLKRRMLGLVSYYRGGKAMYYPTVNPVHFEEVPMSSYQFNEYKMVRDVEREKESVGAMAKLLGKVATTKSKEAVTKKVSSLFRVFSRQFSNFVFPEMIERPFVRKFVEDAMKKRLEKKAKKGNLDVEELEKENKRMEENKLSPKDKTLIEKAIKELGEHKDEFLKNTANGLKKYSPKMAKMVEIMNTSPGLILVYSTFRSLEGIGVFSLVLEANGWAKYDVDDPGKNSGKPKYAIYSGVEDDKEKEEVYKIFRSEENKYGEKIKALLVTSAGAEGLDLKNIRQVHVMEPYWHDVRIDQVIGRANRFMSHVGLPEKDRVVDVYRYMTILTPEQLKDFPERESTDQYIYEVAKKKLRVTDTIKRTMKEVAVDCVLNGVDNEKDIRCFSFGEDARGLAYKADIREDLVYGRDIGTRIVQKVLEPMILDGENNLIRVDRKSKKLYYYNNKEGKSPLVKAPKVYRKVGVDVESGEVYEVIGEGRSIKLGVVNDKGKLI